MVDKTVIIIIRYDVEFPDLNEIIKISKIPSKRKSGRAVMGIQYSAMKKKYTEAVKVITRRSMINGFQFVSRVDITCNWFMKDKRKDPDNVSAGIKFILDGVVKAGLLEDDRYKHIASIKHNFFVSDNRKAYVTVELKEEE